MAGATGFTADADGFIAAFPTVDFIPFTYSSLAQANQAEPNKELIECQLTAAAEYMASVVCDAGCLASQGEQIRTFYQFSVVYYWLHVDCGLQDDDVAIRRWNDAQRWLNGLKACCQHTAIRSSAAFATGYGGDCNRVLTAETLERMAPRSDRYGPNNPW